MGHHGYARGAVYDYSVPAVGGVEEVVVAAENGGEEAERGYRGGISSIRGGFGGGCGGVDDPVGCVEDEDDAGEGEGGGVLVDGQDLEGGGREGVLEWCWAQDDVD